MVDRDGRGDKPRRLAEGDAADPARGGEQVPPEVAQFLGALFAPEDLVLFRFVETWAEGGKKQARTAWEATRHHRAGWAASDDKFWPWVLRTSAQEKANAFFGVCPRFGGDRRFDLAWQVRTVRALWADLDHCTPEEALARCGAAGLPPPSLVVSSGNGVHLYWILAEPYLIDDAGEPPAVRTHFVDQGEGKKKLPLKYIRGDDGLPVWEFLTDPETKGDSRDRNPDFPNQLSPKARHAQDVLAGVAAKVGGDHTKDLARLLRLPDTLNRKDERNGATPKPCTLAECHPDRRYPFADFERFAADAPAKVRARELAKVKLKSGVKLTAARRNNPGEYVNCSALAELGLRSKADFSLCCYYLRTGLDKEEVWGEVQDVGKFSDRGRDYFDLTWEKAEAEVRTSIILRHVRGRRPAATRPRSSDGNGDAGSNGWHAATPAPAGGGPPPGTAPAAGGLRPRPEIVVNDRQLCDVTADALGAILGANDPPRLFQRGGLLARLRVDPCSGAPSLQALGEDALRGHLARAATWVRLEEKANSVQVTNVTPPVDVVRDLDSLPGWEGVPPLVGLVESPVLDAGGRLVIDPGYHPHACLYYRPARGFDVPAVPPRPSAADVARAKGLLLGELFGQFPFVDVSGRAHALAAALLPFVRELVDGPTPLHLFDAPVEGTGKSLLVECIAVAATGREAAAMTESSCDDEWRKRITALLVEGPAFVLLDNVNRTLDSAALAAVATARTWKDRVLGSTKTVEVPNRAVWMLTGNNVKMSRELIRRTVYTRIDARTDAPWERTGFKHRDLLGWAKANRGKLVWAALTLCQAWVAAGRPPGTEVLGKYESWAETMGGILAVAGVPGLLANAEQFRAASADQTNEWREFVAAWWAAHACNRVGVGPLYKLAVDQQLLDGVLGDKGDRSQRIRLGVALGRMRDRVVGDFLIGADGKDHSERQLYRLTRVRDAGASPARQPGDDSDAEGEATPYDPAGDPFGGAA